MELMSTCLDKLLKKLKAPLPERILGKVAVAVSIENKMWGFWSFVYIRKTYIDQSPKPQIVQICKMCAFYVHFMQIRWKCKKMRTFSRKTLTH